MMTFLGDDDKGQGTTAAGDKVQQSLSESCDLFEEDRDRSAMPRPIVWSLPCFTRDMQVGRAWWSEDSFGKFGEAPRDEL